MIRFRELDPHTTLADQLHGEDDGDPVVVINTFAVPLDAAETFVRVWSGDGRFMQAKQGFISAQLYAGAGGSGTHVVVAEWASLSAARDALTDPAFRKRMAAYPEGIDSAPHIFRKVAIPGLCQGPRATAAQPSA